MRIGLIGSGKIGSTLARLAVEAGHQTVLSNSRGPETLASLVSDLGPLASAGTVDDAAEQGEVVVIAIPMRVYSSVPVAPLAGKVVIDTYNYYPDRDGRIPELEARLSTSSELLAAHLPEAHVVKAFNTIYHESLAVHGRQPGSARRRALPIAGDTAAKKTVSALIDQFGFDVVDAGPLVEGWRFQPGTPAFNVWLDAGGLRAALDSLPDLRTTSYQHQVG